MLQMGYCKSGPTIPQCPRDLGMSLVQEALGFRPLTRLPPIQKFVTSHGGVAAYRDVGELPCWKSPRAKSLA
jgi:hypothetical protein